MARLLINRIKYIPTEYIPTLYYTEQPLCVFRKPFKNFLNNITSSDSLEKLKKEFNDPEKFIYYTFFKPDNNDFKEINQGEYAFDSYSRRKFIIEELIKRFQNIGLLVRPYCTAIDFSVFVHTSQFNSEWDIYKRYDFLIKERRNEIIFNVGSEQTLISRNKLNVQETDSVSYLDSTDGYIKSNSHSPQKGNYRIIANKEIRAQLGINTDAPRKFSYAHCYKQLDDFYRSCLLKLELDSLTFEPGGLRNVDHMDTFKVSIPENLMLFGKGKTDVNAISGMRDHGPYKNSPKADENKFIFIYQDRDDANKLYFHFKNGLKHFPGLFSYVGLPPTLERDISLKYTNIDSLKEEFDKFLVEKLSENLYSNYFVIVIGDFIKQETDEVHTDLYYHIKNSLLKKGIPSQFVSYKNIRGGAFHYHLPNIAVAMLAKLGGVPWRLNSKSYDELVVGFNQATIGENRFIGSAVFFSNEGELNKVIGYPESISATRLITHLRNSIEAYISSKNNPPDRLVIHYYKQNSKEEKKQIDQLIQQELRLNIPFAIVEINDHKSQIDIVFDQQYNFGMPESGTYIKVGRDEYLLFNNTRYQHSPVRSIAEELPIKVKIHFADTGGFSHKELITQVYEFSRLYWKGLKQKSQPVTTLYAKMIAEFESKIKEPIPSNDVINKTPWFL